MECEFGVYMYVTIHTEPLLWHAVSAANNGMRSAVAAVLLWNTVAGQQTVEAMAPCFLPLISGCRLA